MNIFLKKTILPKETSNSNLKSQPQKTVRFGNDPCVPNRLVLCFAFLKSTSGDDNVDSTANLSTKNIRKASGSQTCGFIVYHNQSDVVAEKKYKCIKNSFALIIDRTEKNIETLIQNSFDWLLQHKITFITPSPFYVCFEGDNELVIKHNYIYSRDLEELLFIRENVHAVFDYGSYLFPFHNMLYQEDYWFSEIGKLFARNLRLSLENHELKQEKNITHTNNLENENNLLRILTAKDQLIDEQNKEKELLKLENIKLQSEVKLIEKELQFYRESHNVSQTPVSNYNKGEGLLEKRRFSASFLRSSLTISPRSSQKDIKLTPSNFSNSSPSCTIQNLSPRSAQKEVKPNSGPSSPRKVFFKEKS